MQERQRYFESRMAETQAQELSSKDIPDPAVALSEAKSSLTDWGLRLTQLKIERKPGDSAVLAMTQNVTTRLDVRSRKNDIPDGLFRQMTTCQTAANEFLRQFWSATYPPPAEFQTVAVTTPAQRAAKAAKMIGYISKTHEKVQAIVQIAQQHGIDPSRVETAMHPILVASNHALAFHRNKKLPR